MMGWTGMQPPYHGDKKRWLEDEFNQTGELGTNPSWKLTDISIRGNTAYGIYTIVRPDGRWHSAGMVILMQFSATEWAYKDMSEEMMPYYFDAPIKMLDKLDKMTPVSGNAKQWRDTCRAEKLKTKVKVEDGSLLKFAKALNFGSFKDDTFTLKKEGGKTFFIASNGVKCRIPKWQTRDHEVRA
jgi:hypothetical protein